MLRLNLGAGSDRRAGYLNVDRVETDYIDVVHDLEKFPYPWADSSAEVILMHHVLEHLGDIRAVMDELWRILIVDGRLELYVPHFSHFHALTHPEHRHAFCYNSLNMFTANTGEQYTRCLWKMLTVELRFGNALLGRFFNHHKYIYTSTLLAYLFPAHEIKFVMTPIKPPRGSA